MDVPIDIDIARRPKPLSLQGCYQCGDANHLVKNCPYCLNMRQLLPEQWEELIEDLLAIWDMQEVEAWKVKENKDFVENN